MALTTASSPHFQFMMFGTLDDLLKIEIKTYIFVVKGIPWRPLTKALLFTLGIASMNMERTQRGFKHRIYI